MELKNFVDLNEVERILVFGWRNHLKIAPSMKTQTISLKEHLHFLESLKQDTTKQYFLALENNEVLGVICFVDIKLGISCEFGIYQNPDLQGYGAKLMEAMLKYAFEVLNVATLYACAFNHNTKALALYTKFGFNLTNKDDTMSYFTLSAGGGALNSYFVAYFWNLVSKQYATKKTKSPFVLQSLKSQIPSFSSLHRSALCKVG